MRQPFDIKDARSFKKIADGDEEAFGILFYSFTSRLYPFVYQLLNSRT